MVKFYIGIDSGGTKTRARVWWAPDGKTMDFESGPSNLCSSSEEDVKEVFGSLFRRIQDVAVERAKAGFDNCAGVGVGAAGISSPIARNKLSLCLRELLPSHVPLILASDAQTALYGAVKGGAGMIVIAGTGSICLGRNEAGREYKAGGWGHLIDDEGSGYAIGRDILSAVVRRLDGRGESTVLTALVKEEFHLSSGVDIVDYVYGSQNAKARVAAAAPLLVRACAAEDNTALRIALRAADGLMELVRAVAGKLKLEQAVLALRGGILQNMEPVGVALEQAVHREYPGFRITKSREDALDGALYMVMQNMNPSVSEWKEDHFEER